MKKIAPLFFLFFIALSSVLAADSTDKARLLIASAVRQKPSILREFLESLKKLDKEHYCRDYCIIDDNVENESHLLLKKFAEEEKDHCLLLSPEENTRTESYSSDENIHHSTATFKELFIEIAKDRSYDYLFIVDSDLVLHPRTLEDLIEARKEIVSPIFWTSWDSNREPEPQVWLKGDCFKYDLKIHEKIADEEAVRRKKEFSEMLKKPGLYEVGGLSCCFLINKKAIRKGISFKKITSLSLPSEDQHFSGQGFRFGPFSFRRYASPRFSSLSGV